MSLRCRSTTKTGKRCSRKTSHGGYCYQHLPKDEILQHGIPVIKKININNVEIEESSNCNYRNKYGEYKCVNPKFKTSHLCKCHNNEIKKFETTIRHILMNLSIKTQQSIYTISLHSKLTQFLHISNFMYKHKEKILYVSSKDSTNHKIVTNTILSFEREMNKIPR